MRFTGFTDEWKKTTLGAIGKTFNGLSGKSSQDFGQGSPYITYKSVFDNSKVDISRVDYVSITDDERVKSKQNLVQYGDIFFTTSSETPNEVGMTAVLLDDVEDCYLNSFCFGYRLTNIGETLPQYFRFYLRSNIIRNKLSILAQGSTRFNISKIEVMRMGITLPSIHEQKKIAALLSLIDERITTQNKIIEDLKELKSAIIDLIIDNSVYPKLRFEDLYDKAGEGGTPPTSIAEYYSNGTIPFVKIEDLSGKYLFGGKDYITYLGLCKSSTWLIPVDSIIYSNGATIGAISINKIPVCTKQGILGIIPKKENNVEYLYYLMSSTYFRKQVERIVTEGTMRTAYLKDINHIECPVPDLETQKNVSDMLSSLSVKLELEEQLLTNYIRQRDYLLASMFI